MGPSQVIKGISDHERNRTGNLPELLFMGRIGQ